MSGEEGSIESKLSTLESIASGLIKQIVRDESLSSLKGEDKLILSFFIGAQFFRGKHVRESMAEMQRILKEKIIESGADLSNVEGYYEASEEEIKKASTDLVLNAKEYVPLFYNKMWLLFKTSKSYPFMISDNPVTLQNLVDHGLLGNLGLAVKGIEIYFPISKRLNLGILCRSHEEEFRAIIEELPSGSLEVDNVFTKKIKPFIDGMNKGSAIPTEPENVLNANSLQVRESSRYVYSSRPDFSLVREMISENPHFKKGRLPIA